MAINIGDKIFINKPFPDVDSKYGPFSSVEEAWENIGPDGDDIACIGLTVGIQVNPNEPIVDYWFKDACEDVTDLVPKLPNFDNVVEDVNYVHTDNNFTNADKSKLDSLENYDDSQILSELDSKVDKVPGKSLSTEDYTTDDKTKLSNLENYDDTEIKNSIANKVDKINGKGLSTEDYTTIEKTKLAGIEESADVNTIETIKVNGTALTPDANKAVDITIPAAAEYTIAEVDTTTGYAKSYQLTKDNVAIGAKINIPKDLVVSAGEVKIVTTPDVPYEGAVPGDRYIDLTLNDPDADHIYIPINSLASAYTAGNGIDISSANAISVKLDNSNINGLSVSENGLALAVATTTDSGAMSASDKTKLEGIAANADANVIEKIKVNTVEQTVTNKTIDITVPTKTSDLTNDDNVVKDANYVHTDNNYTNIEKTKLAGIEDGAQVNIIESIKVNGTAATISGKEASVTIPTGGGLIDSISVNGVTQTIDVNKNVDITVPTNTSDLTNDSSFITKEVNNLTNYTKTTDLATVATSGSYNDLDNKPSLFSGDYNDLTNKPTIPTALADLTDDTTHRLVSDTDKTNWNGKIDEPASDGTNGQVLTTDGNGGRTWTTVQTDIPAIDDLTNVAINTPTEGQVLIYDSVNSKWVNDSISTDNSTITQNSNNELTLTTEQTIFTGTQAQWDALSSTEKAKYGIVNITDDYSGNPAPQQIVDSVIDGDMRAVTSNAVYNSLVNKQETSTAVTHVANTAIGSETTPVYIQNNGVPTPITISTTPTSDSSNLITSGAVYTALSNKADAQRLGGMTLVSLTQAEYDALETKDPNTLYFITE